MSFASSIAKFAKKALTEAEREFQVRTFQLWTDIVDGTPRDTGTLRANWQFGTELNSQIFESAKDGRSATQAAAGARAGKAAKKVNLKQTVIIFNNTVYADAIERGLGKGNRVPARMVAKAIGLAETKKSVGR